MSDGDARVTALTGNLARRLEDAWPDIEFELDIEEALQRPGAEIAIQWADGPTEAAVAGRLMPEWAHDRPGAYPVRMVRTYTRLGIAASIVTLHDTGRLRAVHLHGPAVFARAVLNHLSTCHLPVEDSDIELQAEMLSAMLEPDLCVLGAWSDWLSGDGMATLSTTLRDALRDPAR